MELTGLEICTRIAEIEGLKHHLSECKKHVMVKDESTPALRWIRNVEYNPLTDDALCFKLMVKHNVDIDNTSEGVHATCFCKGFSKPLGRYRFDKNHNRAILKSIIEAHKND